ncbi:hypothetical protein EDB89DRAFT_1906303 [Lactarius sanguifluus]|nr:hypothetical protein EDB89DRAFT_1906303 [Lactarius sanguifluus]
MKVEGGEMAGKRNASKEREGVALRGQEEEEEGARRREDGEGSGGWEGGKSREMGRAGRGKGQEKAVRGEGEGDGEAKKRWACRTDSGMGEKMISLTSDGEESVGRETWEAQEGRADGTRVGEAAGTGRWRRWEREAGGGVGKRGEKAVRRGDDSAGRETGVERGRPQRESSLTWPHMSLTKMKSFGGQGLSNVDERVARGREWGRGEDGALHMICEAAERERQKVFDDVNSASENLAPSRPQHEKRSTLAARVRLILYLRVQLPDIVSGTTDPFPLVNLAQLPYLDCSHPAWERESHHLQHPVNDFLCPRVDLDACRYLADTTVSVISARNKIVSVWWSGNATLRGTWSESRSARKLNFSVFKAITVGPALVL